MIAIDYRWQAYKLTCYLVIPIGSRINEWFIDCLQAEINRREQEFDYLRTLPASKIACIKDHATYLVTLEAYIQQLKNLVKTHGGRSNATI